MRKGEKNETEETIKKYFVKMFLKMRAWRSEYGGFDA